MLSAAELSRYFAGRPAVEDLTFSLDDGALLALLGPNKGMKQRLAIIRTVFHDPPVVFFDEPTAGLDPESARSVRELILSLKASGRTIIVCTHNLNEAAELADVVGVLRGRLLAYGPPANLGSDQPPRVRISLVDRGELAAELVRERTGRSCELSGETLTATVADPRVDAPPLLRALIEAGFEVIAAQPVDRSLEELYLRVVAEAQ